MNPTTAATIAATLLVHVSADYRAQVVSDCRIEGWDPAEHCYTTDAQAIDNLAALIASGAPAQEIVDALWRMDTSPRETVLETLPEALWNALGITCQPEDPHLPCR